MRNQKMIVYSTLLRKQEVYFLLFEALQVAKSFLFMVAVRLFYDNLNE